MNSEPSVLEKLDQAYGLIVEVLRQAPQLQATSLDVVPLMMLSALRLAQRSRTLRRRPQYREQELPF